MPPHCKQNWAFQEDRVYPQIAQIPSQRRNHRAHQEGSGPLGQPSPTLLKYEINEAEFNFRVYKLVMCSSFLLPFCMAGWSWQTHFERKATGKFWLNEGERQATFRTEISCVEAGFFFSYLGMASWPQLVCARVLSQSSFYLFPWDSPSHEAG